MSAVQKGTVKNYKRDKGYGFIRPDDHGDDVFFHVSALPIGMDNIQKDARVSYEIGVGKKGPCATNIAIF